MKGEFTANEMLVLKFDETTISDAVGFTPNLVGRAILAYAKAKSKVRAGVEWSSGSTRLDQSSVR